MRYFHFTLVIISLVLFSCKKNNEVPLQDQVIELNDSLFNQNDNTYDFDKNKAESAKFDMDKDGLTDIKFDIYYTSSPMGSGRNSITTVSSFNGFEVFSDSVPFLIKSYEYGILFDWKDSLIKIECPKIFLIGDSIKPDMKSCSGDLYLTYYSFDNYHTKKYMGWWISKEGYLCFCNRSKKILGYIKLSVLSYNSVVLEKLVMKCNADKLIIE